MMQSRSLRLSAYLVVRVKWMKMSLGVLVLFPTLAVGWLDFQVDVILARLESDFSDQPPTIPVVPNQ